MCCLAFTVGEAKAQRRGLVSRPRVRQARLCRVQRGCQEASGHSVYGPSY